MTRTVLGSVLVLLLASGWHAMPAAPDQSSRPGAGASFHVEDEYRFRQKAEAPQGLTSKADDPPENIRTPGTYYDFLAFLDDSASADRTYSRSTVRRQLDALRVVLPDSTLERFEIEKGAETGRTDVLRPGAGRAIASWWRWKDPYPATTANERLQEHLKRVAHAFRRYNRKDDDHRLDDRGRVYVRYGPPNRSREFDRGEFWTYGFQTAAEFLFVCERGDGCEFGQPVELIPPRLRYGAGPTQRGMRKALKSLVALESIYKQLSHHRSRYGITYSDLSMYNEQVRQRLNGFASPMNTRPHSFVNQKIAEIKQEEAAARRRRDEVVPPTQSKVGHGLGDLPVGARWVRSLTEAGSTEVELYWSVPRSSLRPSAEQAEVLSEQMGRKGGYLLSSSLVQFSDTYERQDVRTRHFFTPESGDADRHFDPRRETFVLRETPHAALQVDLAWASVEGESQSVRPRARFKVGTSRADSLRPLRDDPSVLEMSDLRPALVPTDTTSIEDAPVYPFRKLPPTTPLALRFDIYHLSTDAEGRTQYTVEYEVLRKADRGGFARFLRGEDEERTAVASRFEGRLEHTEEYVLLDPNNWAKDEAQKVRVSVEVTDEQTGTQVSRAVEFDLPPNN